MKMETVIPLTMLNSNHGITKLMLQGIDAHEE